MNRILTLFTLILTVSVNAQNVMTANDLLALKGAGGLHISPDGTEILYSVSIPRGANEAAEDDAKQEWYMDAQGGEISKLTDAQGGVNSFMWQAGKNGLAYLTPSPASKKEKELKERGYGFIYYEENLKNSNLFLVEFDKDWKQISEKQLTEGVQTWDFTFNRQGTRIAASISPKNLLDQSYMFRRIFLIDPETGNRKQVSKNEGNLGNYVFSPGGIHLAYAAAFNQNDEAVSQAFVVDLSNGEVSNLTPDNFRGTISWVDWKDDKNILCYSGEGVFPKLSTVAVKGGKRKVLLDAAESGIIFDAPRIDNDFSHFVFTASTPDDKSNIYAWDGKGDLNKLTDLNPILAEKSFGEQEVISSGG